MFEKSPRQHNPPLNHHHHQTGTKREVGGGLSTDAGTIAELDEIAKDFVRECEGAKTVSHQPHSLPAGGEQ